MDIHILGLLFVSPFVLVLPFYVLVADINRRSECRWFAGRGPQWQVWDAVWPVREKSDLSGLEPTTVWASQRPRALSCDPQGLAQHSSLGMHQHPPHCDLGLRAGNLHLSSHRPRAVPAACWRGRRGYVCFRRDGLRGRQHQHHGRPLLGHTRHLPLGWPASWKPEHALPVHRWRHKPVYRGDERLRRAMHNRKSAAVYAGGHGQKTWKAVGAGNGGRAEQGLFYGC